MATHLDKIDLKILEALQDNAGLTNLALSEAVALSPSACLARVQKLRVTGVIDHDISIISPAKIGPVLHAMLEITLNSHNIADHKKFEASIQIDAHITMALKVSGRFDYLLAITVSDMPSLNRLSDELLSADMGISKLVTIPVLDVAKAFKGFPIKILKAPPN